MQGPGAEWLRLLLNTRVIVVLPISNAHGYDQMLRTELNVDPNRDFPIDRPDKHCFDTVVARSINEAFLEHVFQSGITFHGGMRAITYEWGAVSHNSGTKLSPDDASQSDIAKTMAVFGGKFADGKSYPVAPINALVYPVHGGMEDWAYAASWDHALDAGCSSSQLGGYTHTKGSYPDSTHRCYMLLVETSDHKRPVESALGIAGGQLLDAGSSDRGHIPRNVRVALVMVDTVEPYTAGLQVSVSRAARLRGLELAPLPAIPSSCSAVFGQPGAARPATAATAGVAGVSSPADLQSLRLSASWDVGGGMQVDATHLVLLAWPTGLDPRVVAGGVYGPWEADPPAGTPQQLVEFTDTVRNFIDGNLSSSALETYCNNHPIGGSSSLMLRSVAVSGATRWSDDPHALDMATQAFKERFSVGDIAVSPTASPCGSSGSSGVALVAIPIAQVDSHWGDEVPEALGSTTPQGHLARQFSGFSEMLWVDRHRPSSLAKLDYHSELTDRLKALATSGELPHILFYGPPGAGKKTRISCLLREIFGRGVERTKLEHRTFKTPTKRTIEVTTVASNYHIQINPADAGYYDRFVVQEVIKEMASSGSLVGGAFGGGAAAAAGGTRPPFKVVLLTEVDHLTKDAQAALRRTMELHSSTCRLILCCESPSKVIDPVRSRCLAMRVPAPTVPQVMSVLEKVCKKEQLTLPKPLAARIASHSKRNLRRAVLLLEACKVQQYPFDPRQPVQVMDWERYVAGMASDIIADQSPRMLLTVRAKLYDLLVNCIPPDLILQTLAREVNKSAAIDDGARHEVASWAAYYGHRLHLGSKHILHLEAFVAKSMAVVKERMMLAAQG